MSRFSPGFSLSVAALSVVAITCRANEGSPTSSFRGPLAHVVTASPATLSRCALARTEYSPPFHHAPYFECVDSSRTPVYSYEVDADSEVTYVAHEWQVTPQARQSRFEAERARLSDRYGPGYACSATWRVWRGPDSVRVALKMQPIFATDVNPPPSDSVPWRLERLMRWGPLVDLYWCHEASGHLGA